MINPIGDNANNYVSPLPARNEVTRRNSIPQHITKLSGNTLYWFLQIVVLLTSISFNVLCNPVVWFMLKTLFNILTEVFIYLVLGVCSFLISVITHIDDYYTRGKNQVKKPEGDQDKPTEIARDGVYVQNCTVKRFVEQPRDF